MHILYSTLHKNAIFNEMYTNQYTNLIIVLISQIRIRILEGRQLTGGNIHPVVRVTVAGQRRETTVKRSTNKPVYNQVWKHALFNLTLYVADFCCLC